MKLLAGLQTFTVKQLNFIPQDHARPTRLPRYGRIAPLPPAAQSVTNYGDGCTSNPFSALPKMSYWKLENWVVPSGLAQSLISHQSNWTMASCAASSAIRILVADSNQMQSQLLVAALRRRPEFAVRSCPMDADAILAAVASSPADVALMSADNPRDTAQDLTVIRRLYLEHPRIATVLLLDSYDHNLVVSAFRAGARGLFCFAESPFRLLCKCIHCVSQGQVWANNEQMRHLLDLIRQVPSLRVVNALGHKLLTPREEQVVALVADGLSNREIAAELNLSEHTIKKYIFRIFDKLGISRRVELVLYAVSHSEKRQAEWVPGA